MARVAVRPSAVAAWGRSGARSVRTTRTRLAAVTDALPDLLLAAAAAIPFAAVACVHPALRCGRYAFGLSWVALAAIGWAAGATASDALARGLAVAALPAWWLAWHATAGRVQQLGLNRWHALWVAVPAVNLVWVGWLLTGNAAAGAGRPGAGRTAVEPVRPTAAARECGPRSADATRTAP